MQVTDEKSKTIITDIIWEKNVVFTRQNQDIYKEAVPSFLANETFKLFIEETKHSISELERSSWGSLWKIKLRSKTQRLTTGGEG